MTANPQVFQPQIVARLNATPLSRNVTRLLKQPANPHVPVVLDLMAWAVENLYVDPLRAQDELGVVVRAALQNPEAVYEHLTTPAMETAQTLEEAAGYLLANLSDVIDDRSLQEAPRV